MVSFIISCRCFIYRSFVSFIAPAISHRAHEQLLTKHLLFIAHLRRMYKWAYQSWKWMKGLCVSKDEGMLSQRVGRNKWLLGYCKSPGILLRVNWGEVESQGGENGRGKRHSGRCWKRKWRTIGRQCLHVQWRKLWYMSIKWIVCGTVRERHNPSSIMDTAQRPLPPIPSPPLTFPWPPLLSRPLPSARFSSPYLLSPPLTLPV